MPIQTPLSGTGQFGDPCLNEYHGCSGAIPPASGFLPSGYDPRTIQGSDGCKFFNGCYIVVQGEYLRWANGYIGYVPVTPAPEQSPAQLYQLLNPTAPAANPRLSNPNYQGTDTIVRNGQTLYWSDVFNGYTTSTPAQLAQSGNPNISPATPPTYAPQGAPVNAQGQFINPQSGQPITVTVDTTPIAVALDRFIAEGQAAQPQNQQNIAPQVDRFIQEGQAAQAQTAATVDRFISEGQALQQAQTANIDRFISEGQQAQSQNIIDAVRAAMEPSPDQLAADQAQVESAKAQTQLVALLTDIAAQNWPKVASDVASGAISGLGTELQGRLDDYRAIFEGLLSGKFKTWADLESALQQVSGSNNLAFLLIDVIGVITLIDRLGVIRTDPIATELSQLAQADNPLKALDPGSVQEIFKRSLWSQADSLDELAKQGLNSDRGGLLLKLAEVFAPMGVIEEGVLRGKATPEDGAMWLSQQGFSLDTIKLIVSLYDKIATPQDITRIADKRVWGNQTDPKYGQFAEKPQEFTDFMQQWGLSEKWSDWLWAAHWQLPSIQQINEMLHRKKITQEDIDAAYGLTDWLPFFRDKLQEISYLVPGRIDVRRMLHAGIIDAIKAQDYHEQQGYTPEDAANLVKLDEQTSTTDEVAVLTKARERIQGHIESAYSRGTISRADAIPHLAALGMPPSTASLLLDILDHERGLAGVPDKTAAHSLAAADKILHAFGKGTLGFDNARENLTLLGWSIDHANTELNIQEIERQAALKGKWADAAVKLYGEHTIEYPEFKAMLSGQGFNGQEMAQLAQEAELNRVLRTKRPTEVEYAKALKKGKITEDEYWTGLKGLGFAEQFRDFMIMQAQL